MWAMGVGGLSSYPVCLANNPLGLSKQTLCSHFNDTKVVHLPSGQQDKPLHIRVTGLDPQHQQHRALSTGEISEHLVALSLLVTF